MVNKPNHPKRIGEVSELIIAGRLLSYKSVYLSKPFGDNCPYDLVLDFENKLFKIQIKTGILKNGCVRFNTTKSRLNTKKVYSRKSFRLEKAKNNQIKNIVFASDNTIEKFMSALRETEEVERFKVGEPFDNGNTEPSFSFLTKEGVET